MRVLFVDDDEVVASSVETALRQKGFDCEITGLGERALSMSKSHDYDIIVIDVGLPDIDGDQVARRMKMEGVKTPLLLQSGLGDPLLPAEAKSLGAAGFLAKPFSIADLIERMEAILGRSGLEASDPPPDAPASAPAVPEQKARPPAETAPEPVQDAPSPRPSAVAQARAALLAQHEPPSGRKPDSE